MCPWGFAAAAQHWSRVSESVLRSADLQHLALQHPVLFSRNPLWFSQPDIRENPPPGIGTPGRGAQCGAEAPHSTGGTSAATMSLLIFNHHIISMGPAPPTGLHVASL